MQYRAKTSRAGLLGLVVLLFIVPFCGLAQPQQVTDLASTHLHSVCYPNQGSGSTGSGTAWSNYGFTSACPAVVSAWGSAAVDERRNQLIIFGGGHSDYYGNDLFRLNPVAGTMTEVTTPSVWGWNVSLCTGGTVNPYCEANPDGTPVARHPYGGFVSMPSTDSVLLFGGGLAPNGTNSSATWVLNRATLAWTQMDPTCTGTCTVAGQTVFGENVLAYNSGSSGAECAWDQNTNTAWCNQTGNGYLFQYDPSTNAWVKRNNGNMPQYPASTPSVDPLNKRLYWFGFAPGDTALELGYVDISGADSTYSYVDISGSVTGCSSVASLWPGVVFDPILHKFVLSLAGAGNSLVIFDPIALTCASQTLYGATIGTSADANGRNGRFNYLPGLNEYVLVNSADNDAYVITLGTQLPGLGKSAISSSGPCLDVDGDGYGVGAGCTGADADDTDPTVHSAAQAITKYGSINAFLVRKGYQSAGSPAPVYCIATSGNDSTGAASTNADTACTHPYLTWYPGVYTVAQPAGVPFIAIFRGGTYTASSALGPGLSGTATQQVVVMSYPGEQATYDFSGGVGDAVDVTFHSYTTISGLRILANTSGNGYHAGNGFFYPSAGSTTIGNVIQYCDVSGAGNDSNIHADNLTNNVVQYNVAHDPDPGVGQHNIYLGSTGIASTGVTISSNIAYNVYTGGYPNLQWNGRCSNCFFENNWIYNSDKVAIALYNGVSNSFVRNNLTWNTGSGSTGYGSPGQAVSLLMNSYQSMQCQVNGQPDICPWDQTGNLIENNTFWSGTNDIVTGTSGLVGNAIAVTQQAVSPCQTCGNTFANTFRNNIVVGTGNGANPTPVNYSIIAGNPHPASYYAAQDTWQNNLISRQDGSTTILQVDSSTYGCSSFGSVFLIGTGCSTTPATFAAVNTSFWNAPQSFRFAQGAGSAALNAGLAAGAPTWDLIGNLAITAPASVPNIGAYAGSTVAPTNTVFKCSLCKGTWHEIP